MIIAPIVEFVSTANNAIEFSVPSNCRRFEHNPGRGGILEHYKIVFDCPKNLLEMEATT